MKEISINFREGRIVTREDDGIPWDMTIMGNPSMDDLIEMVNIDTHFRLLYGGKNEEELLKFMRDSPCDHPNCSMHPYTWDKTQEELDKTYEKDFNEYYEMDKLKHD